MNKKVNIRHWQSAHNDWLRALDFYKEEITILSNRLTEIAGKNTAHEISAQVEHFQNQFILHLNNIDELKHAIKINLGQIAAEINTQNGFVSDELLLQAEREKNVFSGEEKEINELRHSFNTFSATWM